MVKITTHVDNKDGFDTKLDLYKSLIEVKKDIGEAITEDFTLCKLDEKSQEFVTEMLLNSHLVENVCNQVIHRTITWGFDQKRQVWIGRPPSEELTKKIKATGQLCFTTLMLKPFMVTILNRNKDDNPLLKGLLGIQDTINEPKDIIEKVDKAAKEDKEAK